MLALFSHLSTTGMEMDSDAEVDASLLASALRDMFRDVSFVRGTPEFGPSWSMNLAEQRWDLAADLQDHISHIPEASEVVDNIRDPQEALLVTAALAHLLVRRPEAGRSELDAHATAHLLRAAFQDPPSIWSALAGQAEDLFTDQDLNHLTQEIVREVLQGRASPTGAALGEAVRRRFGIDDPLASGVAYALFESLPPLRRKGTGVIVAEVSHNLRRLLPHELLVPERVSYMLSSSPACDALGDAFMLALRTSDPLSLSAWSAQVARAARVVISNGHLRREEEYFRSVLHGLSPLELRTVRSITTREPLWGPSEMAHDNDNIIIFLVLERLQSIGLLRQIARQSASGLPVPEASLTPIGEELAEWLLLADSSGAPLR
jgi:hypothetical protein